MTQDHMTTSANAEHVRRLLGGEHLQRLIKRLRKRMSRGEKLSGKIQLHNAASNERAAIDGLMGRRPTRGRSLTIDLDQLAAILAHAQACDSLEAAVVALVGPVPNQRLQSRSRQDNWERLWQASIDRAQTNQPALGWIDDLKTSGLLKRITGGNPHAAQTILDQALTLVLQMPCQPSAWRNWRPRRPAIAMHLIGASPWQPW